MSRILDDVRPGLIVAGAILLFGVSLGIAYGLIEDSIKQFIVNGIASHPALHDPESPKKIWRWWLRAHFHSTGISAFTLALISITALSSLSSKMKKLVYLLIGLGGLYALSWFLMTLLAPALGLNGAHHALPVEILVMTGVGSLLTGMAILFSNIIFGFFSGDSPSER
ncbi:MAG: hypothetical protein ACE5D4_07485 [Thermodesulfobacteriota bacterium]